MKHFLKVSKGDWAETRVTPGFERHHYIAFPRQMLAERASHWTEENGKLERHLQNLELQSVLLGI
jgi:hypothetical protein